MFHSYHAGNLNAEKKEKMEAEIGVEYFNINPGIILIVCGKLFTFPILNNFEVIVIQLGNVIAYLLRYLQIM
jgi:hypothetical protein